MRNRNGLDGRVTAGFDRRGGQKRRVGARPQQTRHVTREAVQRMRMSRIRTALETVGGGVVLDVGGGGLMIRAAMGDGAERHRQRADTQHDDDDR